MGTGLQKANQWFVFIIILVVSLSLPGCSVTNLEPSINREKVVLLHGFARSQVAMWKFASALEKEGFEVHSLGYSSLTHSIDEIIKEVTGKINDAILSSDTRVHFVGHSLGGLLIRSYLGQNRIQRLGNVVFLGSPNKGTPLVDKYKDKWWFWFAGPAAGMLGTSGSDFLENLAEPHYAVGVIAGSNEITSFEHVMKGADDGLVQVESTKIVGMKDFLVVDSGHSMLRYNDEAIQQTIFFLQNGYFSRATSLNKSE